MLRQIDTVKLAAHKIARKKSWNSYLDYAGYNDMQTQLLRSSKGFS